MSIRIAKYISQCGVCSRRDAERLIEKGQVKLNGEVIDSPVHFVTDADSIVVQGKVVKYDQKPKLWLYHKPAGLITTHDDPQGRPTVFDALPKELPRVISVGRLDLNSEGLLLLTNSGAMAHYLEHPDTGWARKYRVRMKGFPTEEQCRQMKKGVEVEGVQYRGIGVKQEEQQSKGHNNWALVTLTEGKNREIRRVFEYFDCPVSRLIRVSYGPFQLGSMQEGEVKAVSADALKNALGKKWKDICVSSQDN
jgi:23S rRNA pseudouridine2605 synthase